jgi:hypothetical protein
VIEPQGTIAASLISTRMRIPAMDKKQRAWGIVPKSLSV